MSRKTLTALILSALLVQGAVGQDEEGIPELDVVESDDLNQLLNEADKPATETISDLPEEEPTAPVATADESVLPPAETGTVENLDLAPIPTDSSSDSLADAVKNADQELPQPLPESGADDLDDLKADLNDTDLSEGKVALPEFTPSDTNTTTPDSEAPGLTGPDTKKPVVNDAVNVSSAPSVFDVGNEERNLLELATSVQGQISNNEWNELATQAKVSSYTVVKDDWLFKISKRLFGSGFYYPKIWALNQFITNPHLIEPGMVLSFSTGSGDRAPEIKLGDFSEAEIKSAPGASSAAVASVATSDNDFSVWGDEAKPDWLTERKNLVDQGVFVQYSTADTIQDLESASRIALVKEYENYEPPQSQVQSIPTTDYDKAGFDKSSRIVFSIKEGFYLNTFVTNNPVQDFGKIDSGPDENVFFTLNDHMYLTFDESVNVLPGDRFSIYAAEGKVKHPNSDREGFKYSITGQVRIVAKVDDKWEAKVEETIGVMQRNDRVTVYTPKIDRITQTFNGRLIEAAVLGTHAGIQSAISFGDVIYIDRGRADGVEMGNVFEMYGFKDRMNGRVIARQPTYKTGELTVITLTDNFATCLVSSSVRDFYAGDIAITKTKEAALRATMAKKANSKGVRDAVDEQALEELDVELKVEDLNDSLLDKADKIQLTEDELAELERQEREKSVIKDSERDLKALERLEGEIEGAEKLLKEAKLDEDKLLEDQNLEEVERNRGLQQQEGLDEIEENLGKRYMDEDLNSKDNPYGLTEFDIEEVDELLNVEKPKEGAGN